MNEFGPRLKALRTAKGLKRKQLATAINTSPAYIAQLEGQFRRPGLETIIKLAGVFEVSVEELMGGKAA